MLERLKATIGGKVLTANPGPEARKRLQKIVSGMTDAAIAHNRKIRKERLQAEIFFRTRRLRMLSHDH